MSLMDSARVFMSVEPAFALVDDRLVITIEGLSPKQEITVHVRTKSDRGIRFASYGCFRANDEGKLNISRDKCLQGTYTGKEYPYFTRRILSSLRFILEGFYL